MMCRHFPPCPVAMAPDAAAAKVMSSHQEQGWSLLCNGAVLFDDGGLLLPDGASVGPTIEWLVTEPRQTAVRIGSPPLFEGRDRALELDRVLVP
jgi:Family of unknown function (DUF5999)